MTRPLALTAAVCSIAVLVSACDLSTGVYEDRHLGAIGYPDNLEITMPDTVQAGQDFTVTVRTLGPTGCWEKDQTVVSVTGLVAMITPYDLVRAGGDIACTQAVVEIVHTAPLNFGQSGVGEIEINGRDGTAQRSVVVE